MIQESNHIDGDDVFRKIIGEKLKDHEVPVPEDGWSALEAQLHPVQKRKSYWLWTSGIAAAITGLVALLFIPAMQLDEQTGNISYNNPTVQERLPDNENPGNGLIISEQVKKEQTENYPANSLADRSSEYKRNTTKEIRSVKEQTVTPEGEKTGTLTTYEKETTKVVDNIDTEKGEKTRNTGDNQEFKEKEKKKNPDEWLPSKSPVWAKKEKKKNNGWTLAVNAGPGNYGNSSSSKGNFDSPGWLLQKKNSNDLPHQPNKNPFDFSPTIVDEKLSEGTSGEENTNMENNGLKYDELLMDNGIDAAPDGISTDAEAPGNLAQQNLAESPIVTHPPGPEDYPNRNYLPPISVGVSVRKDFNRYVGIESGINYTYLVTKFELNNSSQHADLRLHYLGIPLNVVGNIVNQPKWNLYVSAGGMVEKGLKSEWTQYVESKSQTTSAAIKGLQWSLNLAAGVSYKFNPNISIYVEPKMSYYFDNKQPISIRTDKPLIFWANVGFRYSFN